jgi:spore germination protein YaaH
MRLAATLASAFLLAASACDAQRRASAQKTEFWGFAAPWDPRSDASIRAHGSKLAVVVTGWIGLDSTSGRPLLPSPFADTIRQARAGPGGGGAGGGRASGTKRMAIVTSWHGDRFHQASIRTLARDPDRLARTAGDIARYAAAIGYRGLVLDFESLEPADLDGQLRVVKAIADSARARGVATIAAAVPATDTLAYPARRLLAVVDAIIPMLYDQHWSGSQPGPVAAPDWVRAALALRIAEAGADRIVAGLPTYGYRWRKGQPADALSYLEARQISAQTRAALSRDAATGTLRARGSDWEMWVTDAALLRTLVRESEAAGVRRFALWRLGREDPAMWGTVVR